MGYLNLQLIDYLLSHAITFTPLILIDFFFKFVINIEQSLLFNFDFTMHHLFFYSHLENDATIIFLINCHKT